LEKLCNQACRTILLVGAVEILERGFLLEGSGRVEAVTLLLDLVVSFQFYLSLKPVVSGLLELEFATAAGVGRVLPLIGFVTRPVSVL